MVELFHQHPYWTISFVSFFVNIPLGYVRQGCQKFSASWFFWIHASIPVIIYLRLSLGTSPVFIPVCIFFAVMGQIVGSRYRSRRMTPLDLEKYDRIADLNLPAPGPKPDDRDVAVVLLNMGGPRDVAGVKDFLHRLFLDPIIMKFPLSKILQPFFAWLIVTLRLKEAQRRYQLIGGGSPIFDSTQRQAAALGKELRERGRDVPVFFSFNYSEPFAEGVLTAIKKAGKKFVLPLSLYPHYSLATTGSNMFYLTEATKKVYPGAQFLSAPAYYLHDDYIQAFADRIQAQLKPGESLDEFYIIFSAHGLPLYFLTQGDLYPFQIAQTAACVLRKLERAQHWSISYQSAVGPMQWLKPSTESVLHALARRNVKKLIVVPISFVTDHIETLCEIDIEYRHVAEKAGISDFRMSRALECHPGFIKALADTVEATLPVDRGSCLATGGT